MKKRFKKIALSGLLIGCVTVGGTGMAVLANGNAYENFKTAAFSTMQVENMTVNADFTVKQNGEVIVSGNGIIQTDGDTNYTTGSFITDGKTIEIESISDDSSMIHRIDEQYTKVVKDTDDRQDRRDDLNDSPNTVKMMKMILDVLVGDTKTHFTGDNNHISVNLEGAQIPELLNVSIAAASEQSEHRSKDAFTSINFDDYDQVRIQSLKLESDLQDGYLVNNKISVVMIGTDQTGKNQEFEFIYHTELSDIGSTTPGTMDVAGKDIKEVTEDHFYR